MTAIRHRESRDVPPVAQPAGTGLPALVEVAPDVFIAPAEVAAILQNVEITNRGPWTMIYLRGMSNGDEYVVPGTPREVAARLGIEVTPIGEADE